MLPGDTYLGQTPPKPHKAPRWLRVVNVIILSVACWCFIAAFWSALR